MALKVIPLISCEAFALLENEGLKTGAIIDYDLISNYTWGLHDWSSIKNADWDCVEGGGAEDLMSLAKKGLIVLIQTWFLFSTAWTSIA